MTCRIVFLIGFAILSSVKLVSSLYAADDESRPNVLFIAVDDLRPELHCYGREHIHSPSIDRLASQGVLFERAYCMVPTCGASRASLMTSIRPARNRFTNYLAWAEKDVPDAVPLNSFFKNAGYECTSLGKVYHHANDHVNGWSQPPWRSKQSSYQDAEALKRAIAESRKMWPSKKKFRGAPFESFEAPDSDYPDGDCANQAIERLEEYSAGNGDQPFFLAVGFLKPHLPFNAPKKYWDLYDRDQIELPANYKIPTDVPQDAPHNSGELRSYAGIHPKDPVDRETALSLIHGYYACVSFVDAQIGRVLDALEKQGLAENTIVILWGDHGWQLGDHGMWNKHSCFETSLHAPLIIKAPSGAGAKAGARVPSLVEFIDVYPTLCDLARLATPSHVEGTSLLPWMRDPTLQGKKYAISRFKNGDSIRDDQYRYSEYRDKKSALTGAMMFDHHVDPTEDRNIFSKDDVTVRELAKTLRANKGKDTKKQ